MANVTTKGEFYVPIISNAKGVPNIQELNRVLARLSTDIAKLQGLLGATELIDNLSVDGVIDSVPIAGCWQTTGNSTSPNRAIWDNETVSSEFLVRNSDQTGILVKAPGTYLLETNMTMLTDGSNVAVLYLIVSNVTIAFGQGAANAAGNGTLVHVSRIMNLEANDIVSVMANVGTIFGSSFGGTTLNIYRLN